MYGAVFFYFGPFKPVEPNELLMASYPSFFLLTNASQLQFEIMKYASYLVDKDIILQQ